MKQPLLILGTSDYTEVFIDVFESIEDYDIVGCVENWNRTRCQNKILDLPIYWHEDIEEKRETHQLICALATTKRSAWIEDMVDRGFTFTSLVHGSSTISTRTELACGVSVDAGCTIAGFSEIEAFVRIGRNASVGHHSKIGEFSTLHPGSIILGHCNIGKKVTVGAGAIVLNGVSIGDGAMLAAGSIITKNVPENALVAGNPAQIKRTDYGPV